MPLRQVSNARLGALAFRIIAAATLFAGASLVLLDDASPHPATNVDGYPLGWDYPPICCNSAKTHPTGDCAPIDSKYVTERPDGYHVDLPKGSHPKLISNGYSAVIPYGTEKPSPEGNYHICLSTNGNHRYCFFAGSRGF